MKKQINPNIKAHLIRSSFYVLLLLAVCGIPFALAQRNTNRRAVTKPKIAAATSALRNDASAAKAAIKGTVKAPSTHFSKAFGRVAQSGVLHKRRTSPNGVVCSYDFTTGSDSIMPGDTDIGNHTDDGDTFVALPFSFQLYDQVFNGVNVSSNGRVDFVCVNEPDGFLAGCIPPPDNICAFDYTIVPNWSDYRTDIAGEGCASFASGCGVFTSVSGSAPNRIFNIEWRAVYFNDQNQTANFEVRLYENDPNLRFDFIFGTVQPGSDSFMCRVYSRMPLRLLRTSAIPIHPAPVRALTRAQADRLPHQHRRRPLRAHRSYLKAASRPAIRHRLTGCSAMVFPAPATLPRHALVRLVMGCSIITIPTP